MTEESRPAVNNPKLRDSSSKLIFGDNILCSQFLRDYADMEILRNIKPDDLEDVSERYVPLYSTNRESDIVKKVNISKYVSFSKNENPLNLPLYIVSLIEHKSQVEYNVAMQVLRYALYIWEDYEKEMEKRHPHISARKDFRYPPVFPIVYYEGTDRWTASYDIADRILFRELLGDYLPHFNYQIVKLHDYSNEELLAKGDEISLAMLINKIRCLEDMEIFAGFPKERLDNILKETPEYLLDIMAKMLRALLYDMEVPVEKTEKVVAKIKERKMGRLFEGVTFNYRRGIEEAKAEAKAEAMAEIKAEAMAEIKAEAMAEVKAEARAEMEAMVEEKVKAARNEAQKEMQHELEISKHVFKMLLKEYSADEIRTSLMQEFSLSAEQAEEKYRNIIE